MNSNLEPGNPDPNHGRERTQGTQNFSLSASDGERAGVRCFSLLLVILILLLLSPSLASAATFTTGFTVTETNFAYDGQDIVISGATVAIDGMHGFNSLLLTR